MAKGDLSGADPGFFLGGGALVSCSTLTSINHIVFWEGRIPVVLENRRSSQGGGGVRTPCTLPLDPPLFLFFSTKCKILDVVSFLHCLQIIFSLKSPIPTLYNVKNVIWISTVNRFVDYRFIV